MGDHQPCTSDHSRQLFVSHQIGADQHCQKCGARWPCDFTQARMQRDALRTDLTAAQATIAQRDAQVAELTAALSDLLSAFVLHRTATHKTRPEYCETCQQGQAEIERARALLARTPAAPEGETDAQT